MQSRRGKKFCSRAFTTGRRRWITLVVWLGGVVVGWGFDWYFCFCFYLFLLGLFVGATHPLSTTGLINAQPQLKYILETALSCQDECNVFLSKLRNTEVQAAISWLYLKRLKANARFNNTWKTINNKKNNIFLPTQQHLSSSNHLVHAMPTPKAP